MRVFLYERVSSEEQVRHGYSLDAQHEALTEFCDRNNHTILGVYKDEGISARKPYTKRPAMVELLRDLEIIKPDIILFTKLDRWFRNIKEYYRVQDILDRNKVDWKAINEEYDTSTASGRLYVNIKLSIAQDEADRTSERVKDIHRQLAMQGKVLGRSVPWGYKVVDKRVVFSDDIDKVKDAIDHYMLNGSFHATLRYINGKYGTHFGQKQIKTLFQNTLLKGEKYDNPNFCKPLLTPEEFDALQAKIQSNIKYASKKRTFLFTGLIRCPKCGRKMAGCSDARKLKYYRCPNKYIGLCDYQPYLSEKKLEQWLLDNIEDDYKVKVTMKPKVKKDDPKKYRDRLTRLNEMYLMGNITQSEYKAKTAEIQQKLAEIAKTAPLKTQIFVSNWKDLYHELDPEHRRSFWHNLIKEIRVDLETQGFEVLY